MDGIRSRSSTSPPLQVPGQQQQRYYSNQIVVEDDYQPPGFVQPNYTPHNQPQYQNIQQLNYADIKPAYHIPRMPSPGLGEQQPPNMYQQQFEQGMRPAAVTPFYPGAGQQSMNVHQRFPNPVYQQMIYPQMIYAMNQSQFGGQQPIVMNTSMPLPQTMPAPQYNPGTANQRPPSAKVTFTYRKPLKEKSHIKIIDPNTNRDITEEILKNNRETGVGRPSNNEINAQFAAQVAARMNSTPTLATNLQGDFPDALDDDPETRLLYEKAINKGSEIDRSVRVMLIGCFGQGKTTLARRLLGENLENIESTDGIDIHQCISKEDTSLVCWKKADVETENDFIKRLASAALTLKDKLNEENEAPENISDQELTSNGVKPISDSNNILKKTQNDQVTSATTDGKRNVTTNGGQAQTRPYENETEVKHHHIKNTKEFRKACEEAKRLELNSHKIRRISLWDFGGQFIYYATHQLFHSKNAVYLLVFNLSLTLDTEVKDKDFPGKMNCKTMQDYILFWMHSIHSFAGHSDGREPVIILVGTHRDKLKNDAEAETYFKNIREIIETSKLGSHVYSEHFAVSTVDNEDKKIDALRKTILDIGGRREQTLPIKWIMLDHKLQSYLQRNIISFADFKKIDSEMEYPVGDTKELKLFLKYNHGKGIYFYFEEDEMSDQIVLNPQFVINAFKCIITTKRCSQTKAQELLRMRKQLTDDAILMPKLLDGVFEETSPDFIEHKIIILFMLKKHRIISEVLKYGDGFGAWHLQPLGYYIVPSLLKVKDKQKVTSFLNGKLSSTVSLGFSFHYSGISETIFHRLLAAAIGTWPILLYGDVQMLFNNVGIFEIDSYHAALIWLQKCRIHLLVVSLCPEYTISEGKGDYFRRFAEIVVKEIFRNLQNYSLQTETETHEQRSYEPYKMTVQCFNPEHKCKGSRNIRTLEQIQAFERDILPCPDNFSHSLQKRQIQDDWFEHSDSDEFPKRKLSHKEYSKLSQAIGEHWETLGLQLGIHNVTIEQIRMQRQVPQDRIFQMFLAWDKINEDATFDMLVKEMKTLPKQSVDWDIVYNIKDEF